MIASHRAWKSRPVLSALVLSMAAVAAYAYAAGQPSGSSGGGTCAPAWSPTNVYTGGSTVSVASVNYTANYWSQGADPSAHHGAPGSREPWTSGERCSGAGGI